MLIWFCRTFLFWWTNNQETMTAQSLRWAWVLLRLFVICFFFCFFFVWFEVCTEIHSLTQRSVPHRTWTRVWTASMCESRLLLGQCVRTRLIELLPLFATWNMKGIFWSVKEPRTSSWHIKYTVCKHTYARVMMSYSKRAQDKLWLLVWDSTEVWKRPEWGLMTFSDLWREASHSGEEAGGAEIQGEASWNCVQAADRCTVRWGGEGDRFHSRSV